MAGAVDRGYHPIANPVCEGLLHSCSYHRLRDAVNPLCEDLNSLSTPTSIGSNPVTESSAAVKVR